MNELVGRAREQARLADLVAGLPQRGGSIVILGEPGIGKSALANFAIEEAARLDIPTATVTGAESEASIAYGALQQIVHRFGRRLDRLRQRPREVLTRALGWTDEGETPDLFALGTAMLELLTDVAADGGLLVVVDDAQWVDESTARVLGFVARRLAHDPVGIVMTVRAGHDTPLTTTGLDVMSVGPLSMSESNELVARSRRGLSSDAERRVVAAAGGNPLALLELPSTFDVDSLDNVDLGERLQRVFHGRIGAAGDDVRLVLLVAALTETARVDELVGAAALLGLDESRVGAALESAVAVDAISVRDDRAVFRHPLVSSAVVAGADASTVSNVHAALARVVPDRDRATWHRAAALASPDDDVAAELEVVARRAASQGNVSVAARAWELAGRVSSAPELRDRRLLRAAEAQVELGHGARATELCSEVGPASLSRNDAARLALIRTFVDPHTPTVNDVLRLVEHTAGALSAGEVDLAAELVITVGEAVQAHGAEAPAAATLVAQRLAAALPEGDPMRIAALAVVDPVNYVDRVAEAVLAVDPIEVSSRYEALLRVRPHVDANPALAQLQARLLDGYRARGQLRAVASLQPIHTWNRIALGDWPEALRSAAEGTRLAEELGQPAWSAATRIGEAFVMAVRGEHDVAAGLIREAERGATVSGANNVLTGVQLTKGIDGIARGRYDEAFGVLRRGFDAADPSYNALQSWWMVGDLAEAAAHVGRVDEIRELVEAGAKPRSPWHAMANEYAAPFLAAEDEVEQAFVTSLAGVVQRWPAHRARLLIEYGSWLRRRRRPTQAREWLRSGMDLADALAMNPWSSRARRELRATGEEAPRHVSAPWESLSAQELQVAEMAARGLSNREIGERLFLSHRTVSSHLYRIYPKLGVSGRAQLAVALGAARGGGRPVLDP